MVTSLSTYEIALWTRGTSSKPPKDPSSGISSEEHWEVHSRRIRPSCLGTTKDFASAGECRVRQLCLTPRPDRDFFRTRPAFTFLFQVWSRACCPMRTTSGLRQTGRKYSKTGCRPEVHTLMAIRSEKSGRISACYVLIIQFPAKIRFSSISRVTMVGEIIHHSIPFLLNSTVTDTPPPGP